MRKWVFCLVLVLVAVPCLAQEGELWNLITIQIDQTMIGEWEALQKELNTALKAAGATERRISQVVRGPSNEYFIAEPLANFAELDESDLLAKAMGEAGAARWIARVTKCVENRRVDTLRSRPDLSIPLKAGRTPKLAVVTTFENLPGRDRDYNDWLVNKWAPAMKTAGMDGVLYFRNAFGGGGRNWMVVTFVDDWATFDTVYPVRESLGDEAYRELVGPSGAMRSNPERKVIRLRPDLSIIPQIGRDSPSASTTIVKDDVSPRPLSGLQRH